MPFDKELSVLIRKLCSSYRLIAALCVLFVGLSSQQALAHAHLKLEKPAANAAVSSAPEALTLGFSEGIELNFSGVNVTGPNNSTVKTGALALDSNDNTQVIVPLEQSLTAGEYHVDWHVVSVDGHKTKGKYSFTVK